MGEPVARPCMCVRTRPCVRVQSEIGMGEPVARPCMCVRTRPPVHVCAYPPACACAERDRYGRAGGSPVHVCAYPPACACMCAYVSVRPCPLGRATGSPLPVTICDVPASGMGCFGCSDGRSRDDLDLVLWFRSSRGARFCMMAG
jgi:hypothetical protein